MTVSAVSWAVPAVDAVAEGPERPQVRLLAVGQRALVGLDLEVDVQHLAGEKKRGGGGAVSAAGPGLLVRPTVQESKLTITMNTITITITIATPSRFLWLW